MNKLILSLVVISLINSVIAQPVAIQTITSSGDYQIISLQDGEVLKSFSIPFTQNYFSPYGILSQSDTDILFMGISGTNQVTVSRYFFANDSMSAVSSIYKSVSFEFYTQPLGYDSNSNIAYIGGLDGDNRLAINAFNFDLHIPEQISFSYETNGNVPIGTYDPVGNNYYLIYEDQHNVTYVVTYNFNAQTTTNFPISGYTSGAYEYVSFFNGKLFLANSIAYNNIWSVNLKTYVAKLVFQNPAYNTVTSGFPPFVFDPSGYVAILSLDNFGFKPPVLNVAVFDLTTYQVTLNNNISDNIISGSYIINTISL